MLLRPLMLFSGCFLFLRSSHYCEIWNVMVCSASLRLLCILLICHQALSHYRSSFYNTAIYKYSCSTAPKVPETKLKPGVRKR